MIFRTGLALLFAAVIASGQASAQTSKDKPPAIETVPCNWFHKVTPDIWGTDYTVQIGIFTIRRSGFGRGVYSLSNGEDAYDYLEKKCRKK